MHHNSQHIAIQALKPNPVTLQMNTGILQICFKLSSDVLVFLVNYLHSACLHVKYSHTIFSFG